MPNVSRLSRFLSWVCTILIVALPVLTVVVWMNFETFGSELRRGIGIECGTPLPTELLPVQIVLGIGVMMLPTSVKVFGLWHLRRLLAAFADGRVYTAENIRALRLFAWAVAGSIALGMLMVPLLSVILTFDNPPGQRVLVFGIGSDDFMALFVSGVFALIAHTMEFGRSLASENAEFV